ncbi:hypothetical protein KVT40_002692 [Elsinoe batatas]|uniref:Uncharacterized protein n=1 Tax=Elsinoe batatas TaxID=2601811 RepID=A0A8K0L4H3_9PEZI|nr:hypothetical protein KVT40_002692 [Elsinoe batatas]
MDALMWYKDGGNKGKESREDARCRRQKLPLTGYSFIFSKLIARRRSIFFTSRISSTQDGSLSSEAVLTSSRLRRAIEPASGASGTAGAGDSGGPSSGDGLSKGAIAGIAIGAVLGILLLLLAGWFVLRRQRRQPHTSPAPGSTDRRDEKRISSEGTPELPARDRPGEVQGATAKWGSFGVQELRTREAAGELYGNGQLGQGEGVVELEGSRVERSEARGQGSGHAGDRLGEWRERRGEEGGGAGGEGGGVDAGRELGSGVRRKPLGLKTVDTSVSAGDQGGSGRTSELFSPLSGNGEGSERMFPGGGSSPVSPLVERRSEVL